MPSLGGALERVAYLTQRLPDPDALLVEREVSHREASQEVLDLGRRSIEDAARVGAVPIGLQDGGADSRESVSVLHLLDLRQGDVPHVIRS